MNRQRTKAWIKDDRAQALAETAIVMPVIMLFFLVMLQYFSIIQAGQLGNYAAFAAARSYAVHGSVNSADDATNMAVKAAAIALAPIARFVPGELFGLGGDLSSMTSDVTSSLPTIFQTAADLVEGYACAEWRLNSSSWGGGGSVAISTTNYNSSTALSEEVDVNVQYPQPLFIPGLASLWNFVAGQKYAASVAPLGAGLGGIAGMSSSILGDYSKVSSELSGLGFTMPSTPPELSMETYVNIHSKCAVGYENWGMGSNASFMPRMHATSDNTDDTGVTTNSSITGAGSNLQQTATDETNYNNAAVAASNACQTLCTADSNLASAHSRDDPIINNPKSTPAQVQAANADLQPYIAAQSNAEGPNTAAQSALSTAQAKYESDSGQTMPSGACGCQ
jgi:hypothetical protein